MGAFVFWLWSLVREPDLEPVKAPEVGSVFRLGLRALAGDRDYRFFSIVRLLGTFAGIASPFYLVYVTKVMHVPMEAMGLYMMASTGVSLCSGLVWAPVANRAPRHRLVSISTVLQLANTGCALLVVTFGGSLAPEVAPFVAASVFLISSCAGSAAVMVNDTTLLSSAPTGERPTYFGFLNTRAGAGSFVLPLGGVILETWGYLPLFGLSTVLAAGAFVATLRLGAAGRLRRPISIPRLARSSTARRVDKAL